tara:strand:+ start:135 stop:2921 length:2787 start_codon:yes stop_codon:yes gene_type:complete
MQSYQISIYEQLLKFLNEHRAVTDIFTHTSIANPKGKFNIPIEKEDEFYNLYYQACFVEKENLYLTEKPNLESSPFRTDIDLRHEQTDLKRQYSLKDIQYIMKCQMKEIQKWTTLETATGETSPSQRLCFIFEKKKPRFKSDDDKGKQKRIVKDGIHLMWPFLVSNAYLQELVRKSMCKSMDLSHLNLQNDINDVFDPQVIFRNNWQLFGSKKPLCSAYKLTHIFEVYEDKCVPIDITKFVLANGGERMLIHYLKIRRPRNECVKIKEEKESDFKKTIMQMSEYQKYTNNYKPTNRRITNVPKCKTPEELDLIKNIVLQCISPDRGNHYNEWIELGWLLYNLHNVDDSLLDVWITYSKRSDGYKSIAEEACIREWNKSVGGSLNLATLHYWAKQDNSRKYKTIMRNFHSADFSSAILEFNEYEIAKLMYKLYSKLYICVSIKDKRWYTFDGIRWILTDSGIHLRRLISTEVWSHLTANYMKTINNKRQESNSNNDNDNDQLIDLFMVEETKKYEDLKNAKKKFVKLKTTSFKSNVMKECMEVFHDYAKEFCDKLDSNIDIIGFKNGVYELDSGIFRNGRSEDYLTMSTKIDYIEYTEDDPIVKEVYKFFSEIYTNNNVRDYVLILLSSFLSGSVKEQKFPIWTGSGSNGKSMIIDLLKGSTGDYFGILPIQLMTRKRGDAGQANPHMANTRGKRILVMQEPDTHTKINVGLMKEYSGGDPIVCRQLYSEPIEFKPQFHMILVCNDMPTLPPEDEAVWRRVRVTQHLSKFKESPNSENPLEFEIDRSIPERMKKWHNAFIWILLQKYKIYMKNGLDEPEEVLTYTNQYQLNQDHVASFISERVQKTNNQDDNINVNQIYDEYKCYTKENYPGVRIKNKTELLTSLIKKFGKFTSIRTNSQLHGWKGHKMLTKYQVENENGSSKECQIQI